MKTLTESERNAIQISNKLTKLSDTLRHMATNDMGHLNAYQAALFHNACDAIEALIESRKPYHPQQERN